LSIFIPVGISIPKPTTIAATVKIIPISMSQPQPVVSRPFSVPPRIITVMAKPVPNSTIKLKAFTGVRIGINACITGPWNVGPRRLNLFSRIGTMKIYEPPIQTPAMM